jgi:hypothetical protein
VPDSFAARQLKADYRALLGAPVVDGHQTCQPCECKLRVTEPGEACRGIERIARRMLAGEEHCSTRNQDFEFLAQDFFGEWRLLGRPFLQARKRIAQFHLSPRPAPVAHVSSRFVAINACFFTSSPTGSAPEQRSIFGPHCKYRMKGMLIPSIGKIFSQ